MKRSIWMFRRDKWAQSILPHAVCIDSLHGYSLTPLTLPSSRSERVDGPINSPLNLHAVELLRASLTYKFLGASLFCCALSAPAGLEVRHRGDYCVSVLLENSSVSSAENFSAVQWCEILRDFALNTAKTNSITVQLMDLNSWMPSNYIQKEVCVCYAAFIPSQMWDSNSELISLTSNYRHFIAQLKMGMPLSAIEPTVNKCVSWHLNGVMPWQYLLFRCAILSMPGFSDVG